MVKLQELRKVSPVKKLEKGIPGRGNYKWKNGNESQHGILREEKVARYALEVSMICSTFMWCEHPFSI